MMKAFYINGAKGRLFCVYYKTHSARESAPIILYPPFAEELNKSRKMISSQARRFLEKGHSVLIVDLYGTGDSEGLLESANVNIWKQDIRIAIEWLISTGAKSIIIWGLRFGALMALNHLRELKDVNVTQVILWQPVLKGEQYITQFLRLRLAADMLGNGNKETVNDLKKSLVNGQYLEVAGYTISPDIYNDFVNMDMPENAMTTELKVTWVETALNKNGRPSPATLKAIEKLKSSGWNMELLLTPCMPFWNSQEIVVSQELLDTTSAILV